MKRLFFILFFPALVFGQIVLEEPKYQNELQSAGTPFGIHVFETDPSGIVPGDGRYLLGLADGDTIIWDGGGNTWTLGQPLLEAVTVGAVGDGAPNDAVNDPLAPVEGDTYFDVDNRRQYTYDATTVAWVIDFNETVTIGAIGDGPPDDATNDPVLPQAGDTYQDIDTGILYTYDAGTATWLTDAVTPIVAQPFQLVTVTESATTVDAVPGTADVYRTGDVVIGGADLAPVRSTGDIKFEVLNNAAFGFGSHVMTGATSGITSGRAHTVTGFYNAAVGGAYNTLTGGSAQGNGALGGSSNSVLGGSYNGIVGGNSNTVDDNTYNSTSSNFIGGGDNNSITDTTGNSNEGAVILGGSGNTIDSGLYGSIMGSNNSNLTTEASRSSIIGSTGATIDESDNSSIISSANTSITGSGGELTAIATTAAAINGNASRVASIASAGSTITGGNDLFDGAGLGNSLLGGSTQSAALASHLVTITSSITAAAIGGASLDITTAETSVIAGGNDQSIANGEDMGIFAGEANAITGSNASVIVGGDLNTITGPANAGVVEANAILGGIGHNINATAQRSTILGGNTITVTQSDTTAVPVLQSHNVAGVLPVVEGTETFTYNDAGELYVLDASGDRIKISREQLGSGIIDPVGLPSTIIPGAEDDYAATWYNHVAQTRWVWDQTNAIWYGGGATVNIAQPLQIVGTAQGVTTGDPVPETADVYRTGDVVIGGADLAPVRSTGDIEFEVLNNAVFGSGTHVATSATNTLISGTTNTTSAVDTLALGGSLNVVTGAASTTIGSQGTTITAVSSGGYGTNSGSITSGSKNNLFGGLNNTASGSTNTIVGGQVHTILGYRNTIVGGDTNSIVDSPFANQDNIILGGRDNAMTSVFGGLYNSNAIVAGDTNALDAGYRNAIITGTLNTMTGAVDSIITGGSSNDIDQALQSAIIGGFGHSITATVERSTILGGNAITVTQSDHSAVPVLQVQDQGAPPVSEAGYSKLYSSGGELFAMDDAGNVTQLTSHPGFAYEILSEAGLIAEWKLNLAVKPRINYTQNGDKGLIEYAGRTISLDGSTWSLHDEEDGSVEQTGSF